MISAFFNPFQAAAAWLVSLLPAGAGDLATGATVMLGIYLVLMAIIAPVCLVGAVVERHLRRHS